MKLFNYLETVQTRDSVSNLKPRFKVPYTEFSN